MFDYNKDIKTRDTMIYGDYSPEYYKFGGVRYYKSLSGETLRQLVDNKFANEDECQNSSPSIGEFLEFLEAHPDYTAHGYTVSDARSDYRVSVEGIEKDEEEQDRDTLAEFVSLNRFADTLEISGTTYSWFD